MKRGYSLIELLVAISILMVMSVGSVVFINDFNSKKELDLSRDQLLSNLRLARSLAVGKQRPTGFSGETEYVQLRLTQTGLLTVGVNGVGTTYFAKQIFEEGVTASAGTVNFGFTAYEAKLIDENGDVRDEPIDLVLSSVKNIGDTRIVSISLSGVIND